MKATSHSTISKSVLALGSAVAIAGLVAAAPAHAATSSSGQCNGQKMSSGKCSGKKMQTDSESARSRHQAVDHTNAQTGAPGQTMKPMSNQKANQPIAAPKTQ